MPLDDEPVCEPSLCSLEDALRFMRMEFYDELPDEDWPNEDWIAYTEGDGYMNPADCTIE